jgi:hypothetical protein
MSASTRLQLKVIIFFMMKLLNINFHSFTQHLFAMKIEPHAFSTRLLLFKTLMKTAEKIYFKRWHLYFYMSTISL